MKNRIERFTLNIKKPLRKYESIIIFHPDYSSKELKTFFKEQKEIIQKSSGSFYNIDSWGKRRLTHPIKKISVGLYFHTIFEAKANDIYELERKMRINEKVLRFMHTQLDPKISFEKHLEDYRNVISLSKQREQEREMRKQKKYSNFNKNYQKNQEFSNPQYNTKSGFPNPPPSDSLGSNPLDVNSNLSNHENSE